MNRTCMGVLFLCILLLLTGCGRNSRSDETETFPNETVAEAEGPKEDHMGDAGQRLLLDYLTDIMEEGS